MKLNYCAQFGHPARILMISAALFFITMGGAQATVIDWDGSADLLWATGANWTGGAPDTAPANDTTTDIARFNLGSYAGSISAVTRSVSGIQIGSGSGALTITSTNITLGAGGVNMESGAAATSIGKLTFGVDASIINNSANQLTLTAAPTLTGKVTFGGTGIIFINAASTGAGGVVIDGADVRVGNTSEGLGTGTVEFKSGAYTVSGNRTTSNALSITGDFTFRSGGNTATFGGTKSTTGNVILTFQQALTSSSSTGNNLTLSTNALVLGGNLEVKVIGGGTTGTYGVKVDMGDIDMGGANRNLTLSQTAGTLTIRKLILNGNLTIDGATTLATSLIGGFDTGGVNRTLTFNNSGSGIPTLSGALTGTASTVTLAGSSTNARIGALTGASAHAFEVDNSGTVTFNGASTFTGGVTVTNGVAVASTTGGVAGTSGPLGTGATIVNGGRLESSVANALLGSSSVTVNGGELRATAATSLATSAVPITLNGGTLRGFNAATINYGGGAINVTDDSSIVNERSGASSGTSMNMTFGTSVAVGNAQLNVTSTDNQTGGLSTVTLGSGTLTGNGILNVTKNPSATNNTVLALTSLGVTGAGNQIAAGNGSVTVSGTTTIGSGSLLVNGNLTATGGVAVNIGGTFRYDTTGTGFANNVTLDGGRFSYNSATNYGGTLTYNSGTIAGSNISNLDLTIDSGKTMSPGNSTGTMVAGATTWANGGTFLFEVNDATGTAGSTSAGWDLLNAASLNITAGVGAFTIEIASLDALQAAGLAQNFNGANNYSWLFVDAGADITSFNVNQFVFTDSFSNPTTGTFSISQGDGLGGDLDKLYINYTGVIPEPSTYALLVGGLGLLAFLRRRKQS